MSVPVTIRKTGSQIGGKARLPVKEITDTKAAAVRWGLWASPGVGPTWSPWRMFIFSCLLCAFRVSGWPAPVCPLPVAGLRRRQGSVTFLDCLPAEVGWIIVKEKEEREGKRGKKQALPSPSWTVSFPWKGLRLLRVKSIVPDVSLLDNKGRGCFSKLWIWPLVLSGVFPSAEWMIESHLPRLLCGGGNISASAVGCAPRVFSTVRCRLCSQNPPTVRCGLCPKHLLHCKVQAVPPVSPWLKIICCPCLRSWKLNKASVHFLFRESLQHSVNS